MKNVKANKTNTNKNIIDNPVCKWDLKNPGKRYFSCTGSTDNYGNYELYFVLTKKDEETGSMDARITKTNNSLFTFVETPKGWKVKIHNFVEGYEEEISLNDLGVVFMDAGARKIIRRYTGIKIPYVDFITGLPQTFVVTDEGLKTGVYPDEKIIPRAQIEDEQIVNSICNWLFSAIFKGSKRSQA